MKDIISAIQRGATSSAPHITRDLRRHTREHGWDPQVVSNTSVNYDGERFTASIADGFQGQGFDHEYGTETTPPSAAIRKYGKHAPRAERHLLRNIAKELGY